MSVTGDMTSDHERESRKGLDVIRSAVREELSARLEPVEKRLRELEERAEEQPGPEAKRLRQEIEQLRAEIGTEAEKRTSAIMQVLNGPWQERLSETSDVLGRVESVGEKMNNEHAKQNRQARKHVRARTFLVMLAVAVLMGWGPALADGIQNWWTGRTEIELTKEEQEAREQNAGEAAVLNRIENAYGALEADEKKVFRGMLNEAERRIEKKTGRSYQTPIISGPKGSSSNPTSSGR